MGVEGRPSAVRQLRGHTMDGGESRRQPKKQQKLSRKCSVCSGPAASHVHYGAVSCYSCRAFFRRGIGKPYCCVEGKGDCTIDFTSRRSCQWCRFDKCLRVGMRQDLVDATLRKKNLSGESSEGREDSSSTSNTLIPTFQSIEQHDVLAQVLLEIDKGVQGVELPVEYQVVGEYREVDLLGDELQFSLVQPSASDFYSLQPPGSCSSSEGSPAEFYSGASPSSQPGSFVELYSGACSPSNSPSDSSFGSSQAAVDIESLVDQCFLEEVIHNV